MRDLGAFVVLLTARPLLAWFSRGDRRHGLPPWAPADIRAYARRRPREGEDFTYASIVRASAWFLIMVASLAVSVVTAFVRRWTGTMDHPAPVAVMTGSVALAMFAGGALLVSGARWSLSSSREEALDRKLAGTPLGERPRGFLVWLCTPSNGDAVFAALWSLFLTPELYARIVAPAS